MPSILPRTTPKTNGTKESSRGAQPAVATAILTALVHAGLAIGLAVTGCGDGSGLEEGLPFVSIDECEQMGGTPLFDPADERPATMSCPGGLDTIAELDEDFYGTEGGICCIAPDSPANADEAPSGAPR